MAIKDLTKLIEDSMVQKEEVTEVVGVSTEKDIIHEKADKVDLGALISEFYEEKAIIDAHKKRVDQLNNKIKEVMNFRKLDEIAAGGYEAVISTQNRASLNEDNLVTKLKEMGADELISQKDIPNVEMIEERIYSNEFNPATLADCMEYKIVQTLKVKKSKKKVGS